MIRKSPRDQPEKQPAVGGSRNEIRTIMSLVFWKPNLRMPMRPEKGEFGPRLSVHSPLDPFAFVVYPRELGERAEEAARRMESLGIRAVRYNPREPWEDPVAVVSEGIGEAVVVVVVEPEHARSEWVNAELTYARECGVPLIRDSELVDPSCGRRVAGFRRRWHRVRWRETLWTIGENIGVPTFVRGIRWCILLGSLFSYLALSTPRAFLVGFLAAATLSALCFLLSRARSRDEEVARRVEAQRVRILQSFAAVPERPGPAFVAALEDWAESGVGNSPTWIGEGAAAAGTASVQLLAFLVTAVIEYVR